MKWMIDRNLYFKIVFTRKQRLASMETIKNHQFNDKFSFSLILNWKIVMITCYALYLKFIFNSNIKCCVILYNWNFIYIQFESKNYEIIVLANKMSFIELEKQIFISLLVTIEKWFQMKYFCFIWLIKCKK